MTAVQRPPRATAPAERDAVAPVEPALELAWGERRLRSVEGVDVHVERRPGGRGTLACLHGFASGTFTWAGLVHALGDRAGVLAWDRPPFGRSGRPVPRAGADPYALGAELSRTRALVAEERARAGRSGAGEGPLVLVGHSQGALLACEAVLAGAVRPDALVLIAPALDAGPPPLLRRLAEVPGTGLAAPAVLRLALLGAEPLLRGAGRHRTAHTDATAAETARLLRRPGTASALWHLTRHWTEPTVLERLHEVDVPAVVVGGVDDRIVSEDVHRTAADLLGADLHLLEGAGHSPQEQVPDVVAGIVSDVLDRC